MIVQSVHAGGHTAWKETDRKWTRDPSEQNVEHEPAMSPCCREGQWYLRLHYAKYCQCTKRGDLLNTSESISGVLCLVLGYPVQGELLERVQQRPTKKIKNWNISPMWKGWERWSCSALRQEGSGGIFRILMCKEQDLGNTRISKSGVATGTKQFCRSETRIGWNEKQQLLLFWLAQESDFSLRRLSLYVSFGHIYSKLPEPLGRDLSKTYLHQRDFTWLLPSKYLIATMFGVCDCST